MAGSDEKTVSLAAEYQSLRAEIERRSTIEQAVFVLNLTAVGALVSLALKQAPQGAHSLTSSRSYFLTLLVPFVNYALARLWIDHHDAIMRIGRYIRTALESRSDASWETSLQAKNRRSTISNHYHYWFAYFVSFAGPAIAALVFSLGYATNWERRSAWVAAALLTVANVLGWIDACRPAGERAVPFDRVEQLFRQGDRRVRAELGWDALREARCTAVAYFVDADSDFTGWWMPWYRAEGDPSVEVQQEKGGVAIRVTECGNLPSSETVPHSPKVKTVSAFESEMRKRPAKFEICTYEVGARPRRGRLHRFMRWLIRRRDDVLPRIVLDGNHHLAAALRSGATFTAEVYEIRGGPSHADADGSPLPDLRRDWARDGGIRAGEAQ